MSDAPTRELFASKGYVVFRNLIPRDLIDLLLRLYRREILPYRKRFFRQTTNSWETNRLTAAGNVIESFLDIHDMRDVQFAEVCREARQILCHGAVREALKTITGTTQQSLMQSMLFDQNAGTGPHQDWYYLDSVPNGYLLAGWFALEDIDEKAGRFFVMPGTNHHVFDLTNDERTSNELYIAKVAAYMQAHASEVKAPALMKGDVLFWHSRTIHGSLPTQDQRLSRKSLTAHYMPAAYDFGNMHGTVFPVTYREHDGMRYRYIDREYSMIGQLRALMYNQVSNKYPKAYRAIRRVRS